MDFAAGFPEYGEAVRNSGGWLDCCGAERLIAVSALLTYLPSILDCKEKILRE